MLIHCDVEKGPHKPLMPSARQNSRQNLKMAYSTRYKERSLGRMRSLFALKTVRNITRMKSKTASYS